MLLLKKLIFVIYILLLQKPWLWDVTKSLERVLQWVCIIQVYMHVRKGNQFYVS